MSNVLASEKVISHFDQQGSVHLRAVIKSHTPVTELASCLAFLPLYEVWILPEEAEAFLPKILDEAAFNSVDEMLVNYDMNRRLPSHHAVGRLSSLLGELGANMCFDEVSCHVSVIYTDYGPVISYVLGHHSAIKKVYERQLRERPTLLKITHSDGPP